MLDNQLFQLIITTIKAGYATAGLDENMSIQQAYQPTLQGVDTAPALYIFKVGPDKRIGSPRRKNVYNPTTHLFDHSELQQYESMFQISALATQDPSDIDSLTASDILNLVAYILQSDVTIATLEAAGVGILRIQEVRNTPFMDDKEQFEYAPSFDFTLTHKQDIVSKSPVVTATQVQILNV